jgi:aldehyde dehydrogenase
MTLNQDIVAEITREVVARLQAQMQQTAPVNSGAEIRDGVFPTVDDAVKAAAAAQLKVGQLSLDERAKAVAIIKRMCDENADDWGRQEMEETKIGRLDHKVEKLKIVKQVLGTEAMHSDVRADSTGLCLIERARGSTTTCSASARKKFLWWRACSIRSARR